MKRKSPTRVAWSYLAQQKVRFASALFWRAIYVVAPMQVPIITGALVDRLASGPTGPEQVTATVSASVPPAMHADLGLLVAGLMLVALVYGYSAYAQMIASHRLSRHFVGALRKSLVEKITYLGLHQHKQHGSGDLLDRVLTDTANLRRFVERVFIHSVINVLRVTYPIGMILLIDPWLSCFALSVLPPQIFLTKYLQNRLHRATQTSRRTHSDLTTQVKEHLDGLETIKVLNAESSAVHRISRCADQLETDELGASQHSSVISGTVFLMTSIGIGLTWWQGSLRVIEGQMTIGALVVFTGFVAFVYQPFRQYTTMISTYRRGLVSLERIHELTDAAPSVWSTDSPRAIRVSQGQITFDNVCFGFDRRSVLKQVNLSIEPRQLTVIVGKSGSGKSSILRLIARLYEPDGGRILIDGQDLAQICPLSLRSQIAVVPQQPLLFSRSILDNVRLGRPAASHDEIESACAAAGALEFIQRTERGFNTRLGRAGTTLSGGQAQRLAIARALLVQPSILLLDEPTSALDTRSESAILETLSELRHEVTTVVVGHGKQTTKQADHVVLMDAGRVVGKGSHDQLLTESDLYSELFGPTTPPFITTAHAA